MEGACRPALGEYLQYNGRCYALTVYQRIAEFNKVITVDIGDFTLDYLMIRGEKTDFVEDVVRIVEDMSKNAIVRYLNDHGVLCPSLYKRECLGLKYQNPQMNMTKRPLWCAMTVTSILRNR